jgi:ubiquinone/menaquinone biosynthesis C-methylase UbiE
VIQLNLDEGLSMFDDATFDVVLQIDTLQHLRNAEVMLRETARVGKHGHRRLPQLRALAEPPEHRCAAACR